MRLKKVYSAREVAAITGLTARQLQWWELGAGWCQRRFPRIAPKPAATRSGATRHSTCSSWLFWPISNAAASRRTRFGPSSKRCGPGSGVRLFEAISGSGRVGLLTDGREIYARTETGQFFNLLREPSQPLLVIGEEGALRQLSSRLRPRKKKRSLPGRKSEAK